MLQETGRFPRRGASPPKLILHVEGDPANAQFLLHILTQREVISFDARKQINRNDFGLTWNMALETGGFLVGDIIKIELAVEASKQSV